MNTWLPNFTFMKKCIVVTCFIVAFAFSMCTYVVAPQNVTGPAPATQAWDTTKRVAVIESWMGHTCIAPPAADDYLDTIASHYDSSFIAITIHDDYFAEPCPPHTTPTCGTGSPNAFSEDFRCATGADYSAHFPNGPLTPVQGLVNRRFLGVGNEYTHPSTWEQRVDTVVNQNAIASIHVLPSYVVAGRTLSVEVGGAWMQSFSGTLNIAVMMTEDSLIGWQTLGTNCDSQYVFNNVLRECLNSPGSITGTQMFSGTSIVGTSYSYSLSSAYTIPANFNDQFCNVVVLVYDTNTDEILLAWKESVR